MLLRVVFLLLPAMSAACGGEDKEAQPTEERTYYCGSYEPLGEGTVSTEPPC